MDVGVGFAASAVSGFQVFELLADEFGAGAASGVLELYAGGRHDDFLRFVGR